MTILGVTATYAPAHDEVRYRARCPACGRDADWRTMRPRDTQVSVPRCDCPCL